MLQEREESLEMIVPSIESVEDAIDQMLNLEEIAMDIFQDIRAKQKRLIRVRFKEGRIISEIAESSEYGDEAVDEISDATGISRSVLYQAKKFYELPRFERSMAALNQWITEKEEEKGRVTWSYCRNVARKSLTGKEDKEAELDKQKRNLERRARRLEEDASDLANQAEDMDDAEAIGVAEKAREVAEDLKRQELAVPKQTRITDENYLEFIRGEPCCVTGREGVDPHHLITVGAGGSDYTAIPLTRQMHRELHTVPLREFEDRYDVNLWRQNVKYIIKYLVTR